MASEWYYARNGEQQGPHSTDELRQLSSAGEIGPDDLVWKEGMPEWTPASRVQGLSFATPAPANESANPYSPAAVAASAAEGVLPYFDGSGGVAVGATGRALDMLRQTKPWVRLFSILIFIGVGLVVILGLLLLVASLAAGARGALVGSPALLLLTAVAALYIAPGIYLSRYASRITSLVSSRSPQDLEAALEAQKSFWKFVGIVTTIVLSIYAIIFIISIIGLIIRFSTYR